MTKEHQKEWFELLIEHQLEHYTYAQQALLLAVCQHIKDQHQRLNQLKAELDARLWNPSEW